MPEASNKAVGAVTRALEANKNATTAELRRAAEAADPSIKKLDARRFNARYVLTAKRRLGIIRTRRKKGSARRVGQQRRAGSATVGVIGGELKRLREVIDERLDSFKTMIERDLAAALKSDSIAAVDAIIERIEKARVLWETGAPRRRGRPRGSKKKRGARKRKVR